VQEVQVTITTFSPDSDHYLLKGYKHGELLAKHNNISMIIPCFLPKKIKAYIWTHYLQFTINKLDFPKVFTVS